MNLQKLIRILRIQTETYDQFRMFAYIIREVKTIPGCLYYANKGNLYITKGVVNDYPCLVAHMDTVHKICEDLTTVKIGENITGFNRYTMQQSGIGGDDKVGVFIALECLHLFDHIKIAFFRDEEGGCKGSYEADTSFFDNCNFVLQCDRQGNRDFVTEAAGVELSSKTFKSAVLNLMKMYGYSFSKGMMTDVMALKELEISCSMANISCGYYNPHTEFEFVNIHDIENCLNLVKSIIQQLGHISYPHKHVKTKKHFRNFHYYNQTDYCLDCDASFREFCQQCNDYNGFLWK